MCADRTQVACLTNAAQRSTTPTAAQFLADLARAARDFTVGSDESARAATIARQASAITSTFFELTRQHGLAVALRIDQPIRALLRRGNKNRRTGQCNGYAATSQHPHGTPLGLHTHRMSFREKGPPRKTPGLWDLQTGERHSRPSTIPPPRVSAVGPAPCNR